jgi:hypothetical protein
MSAPLSWGEQLLCDPEAVVAVLNLCDGLIGQEQFQTFYRDDGSLDTIIEIQRKALEAHPDCTEWICVGKESQDGVSIFAFCGNGPQRKEKAYFIQLALHLLPVLLRQRLGWMEHMGDALDVDDQLRHTES